MALLSLGFFSVEAHDLYLTYNYSMQKNVPSCLRCQEFNLCAVVVFFSLASYLREGIKEMVLCKVLSQGIPQ